MGEWDLHKAKAQRAYQQLCEDTALSKSSADVELLMFDLEQSLATLVLTTNVVFSNGIFGPAIWESTMGKRARLVCTYTMRVLHQEDHRK